MPIRPPDFKSSGVRVERIIASGSNKNPRLLIIGSGSTQSNGVNVNTDTLRLTGTGSDTWLFISGSTGTTDRITLGGNTFLSGVLFGGNLAITGTQLSVQSQIPHGGQDVNFFVDGIAGSKDTSTRGTSVFVGDMVVSGVIRDGAGVAYFPGASTGPDGIQGDLQFNDGSGGFGASSTLNFDIGTDTLSVTKLIVNSALSGSLTTLADGSSYLIEGSNITILSNSNGSVTISSIGGGTSNWNELSPSPRLNTTASVAIAGGLGSSYAAESRGSDVFFFVSGTAADLLSPKRAVFGGDVYMSGNLSIGSNDADGRNSFAQGRINWASGSYSNAIGLGTHARGEYSHAEGNITKAYGDWSHAEGDETKTYGMWSHAEGAYSEASGSYSHAAGIWTIASGTGQSTVGKYNLRGNNTSLFVVGNGANNANRSDIFRVDTNSVQITGSLGMMGSIIPDADFTYNLGTPSLRWQNVYTGDLHLRNDRGDWTIVEEENFLCVINNRTGKRFKMMLEPLD